MHCSSCMSIVHHCICLPRRKCSPKIARCRFMAFSVFLSHHDHLITKPLCVVDPGAEGPLSPTHQHGLASRVYGHSMHHKACQAYLRMAACDVFLPDCCAGSLVEECIKCGGGPCAQAPHLQHWQQGPTAHMECECRLEHMLSQHLPGFKSSGRHLGGRPPPPPL